MDEEYGWLISAVVGFVLLFVIMFVVGSCSSCVSEKDQINNSLDHAEGKIALRYYLDDDYQNSQVGFMYVEKGKSYTIEYTPVKEGYRFLGWFDNPNQQIARQYADFNGRSILLVQNDIILYPIFVKE